MRFTPYVKVKARPVTPRRIAAARRAVKRDADSVALFPELQHHETPEERIADIDNESAKRVQQWRNHIAYTWRSARKRWMALPTELRHEVMQKWQAGYLPGSVEYFADIVHGAEQHARHAKFARECRSNAGLPTDNPDTW